jgi:hypothetical protein
MKKHIIGILIGIVLIISLVAGCQGNMEATDTTKELKQEGKVKLEIKNDNKYANLMGINAPAGVVSLIEINEIKYLKLMEFMLQDEGSFSIFVSEKESILNPNDLKEGAYEVSELTALEGDQEYRLSEEIPLDKIKSIAIYDKEADNLVAWANFN